MRSRHVSPAHRRSPLPGPLRWLGPPLAAAYALAVNRRNQYWNRHAPTRVDRPVVSVGNLSAGGTGKTPVVSWIAAQLLDAGIRPAIAMRGYKSPRDGKSDEQLEHESRLPDVPVIANPDRARAITDSLRAGNAPDVILLDDGFQHRRLHRDLDIVLVDVLRSPFDDTLLPRGYLREPVGSLARADVIALTRTDLAAQKMLSVLRSRIGQVVGAAPQVEFQSTWSAVDSTDAREPRDVGWLSGRTFVAVCGIGHPDAFLAMAGRSGARLADTIIRRDHHHYTAAEVAAMARQAAGADGLLTTAKDWVKIEPLMRQHAINIPVHRPRLTFEPTRGGEALISRIVELVRTRSEPS